MKKVTKPLKPQEEKFIFTEGINYFYLGNQSVWGSGDRATLKFFQKAKISGNWLNLAAGDGRYNLDLLKKADRVIASDIDKSALAKLWHLTPKKLQLKLKIKLFNIVKKFPFKNATFDGVFCTGTLHFFPKNILLKIFSEIDRVLKPDAQVIIDFAFDVKRVLPDGSLYIRDEEPRYTKSEAKKVLSDLVKNYQVRIIEFKVPEEIVKKPNFRYKFSCRGFLLQATKPR